MAAVLGHSQIERLRSVLAGQWGQRNKIIPAVHTDGFLKGISYSDRILVLHLVNVTKVGHGSETYDGRGNAELVGENGYNGLLTCYREIVTPFYFF